jgi:tRNA A37 threonylcarbamoyladenosine dehydratase
MAKEGLFVDCFFFLIGNPDYVIDAIDNINTKIDLIKYCFDKKLPVISSMGAGAKADPSRIQIADISETFGKKKKKASRKQCLTAWYSLHIIRGSSRTCGKTKIKETRHS